MLLYVLAVRGGQEPDHCEPLSYPDLEAAIAEARQSARELLADGDKLGRDRRHWWFDVYDDAGHMLDSVRFGDTVVPDERSGRETTSGSPSNS